MVVETLAATALSVLLPYFAKGAEEFAKEAGKAAFAKCGELIQAIRSKFSGDEEAERALNNFEKKPARYRATFEDILNEKLEADETFRSQFSDLLKQLGPDIQVIQKMEEGEEVTGIEADKMTSGSAKVDQDIKKGKKVVGAKIKEIGK